MESSQFLFSTYAPAISMLGLLLIVVLGILIYVSRNNKELWFLTVFVGVFFIIMPPVVLRINTEFTNAVVDFLNVKNNLSMVLFPSIMIVVLVFLRERYFYRHDMFHNKISFWLYLIGGDGTIEHASALIALGILISFSFGFSIGSIGFFVTVGIILLSMWVVGRYSPTMRRYYEKHNKY